MFGETETPFSQYYNTPVDATKYAYRTVYNARPKQHNLIIIQEVSILAVIDVWTKTEVGQSSYDY